MERLHSLPVKAKKVIGIGSQRKLRGNITAFIVVLSLPAMASADVQTDTAPSAGQIKTTWSASTGIGYDNNVYQSPRSPYADYAALPAGSNPIITPRKDSGFFVPYEASLAISKKRELGSRLLGSASLEGKFYPAGGSLNNANEYDLSLGGGSEYALSDEEKSSRTLYVGALFEKHENVYVDHESGSGKNTTMTGAGIQGRNSYTGIGVEAKYTRRVGDIGYGLHGQYILNDYQDPGVFSQFDHSYFALDAEAGVPINPNNALNLSYDHTVRDYSGRHARDAQGIESSANPLLAYTYNGIGAKWSSRISPDWMLFLDYDHTRRNDNFQSYDESRENRYGILLSYKQGRLTTRMALHHWERDYPNGFAFDVAGQGSKYYSGNILKLRAESEQTGKASLWGELLYRAQNATDLRYDYSRMLVMAGVTWTY